MIGALWMSALVVALFTDAGPVRHPSEVADRIRRWFERRRRGDAEIERIEIRRAVRRMGYTFLGAGLERIVVAGPSNTVIKVAVPGGEAANRTEADVWMAAPESLRACLVPVLGIAADGTWLVMERVDVSRRGLVSSHCYDEATKAGIRDVTGANLSEDGRILDYGWVVKTRDSSGLGLYLHRDITFPSIRASLEITAANDYGSSAIPREQRTEHDVANLIDYAEIRRRHRLFADLVQNSDLMAEVRVVPDHIGNVRHYDAFVRFNLRDALAIDSLLGQIGLTAEALDLQAEISPELSQFIEEDLGWPIDYVGP